MNPVLESLQTATSPNHRVVKVDGDGMAPTLHGGGVDHLVIKPMQQYEGEGIYSLQIGGAIAIYRVQGIGGGKIQLLLDNKAYSPPIISKNEFEEMVLGIALYQLHRLRLDINSVLTPCRVGGVS
jgi:phage repressor protein C with HTH and peptisase S24 domain